MNNTFEMPQRRKKKRFDLKILHGHTKNINNFKNSCCFLNFVNHQTFSNYLKIPFSCYIIISVII